VTGGRRVGGTVADVDIANPLSRRGTRPDETPVSHGPLNGPWECAFWVAPDFALRSKSNFRRRRRSAEWSEYRTFEADLRAALTAACPDGWDPGDPAVPVAARPVVVSVVWARTLVDTGNLSKSVNDSAEGTLYHTDATVRAEATLTDRVRPRAPWFVAGFAQLGAGAPPAAVDDALIALIRAVREQVSAFDEATDDAHAEQARHRPPPVPGRP
jgi:hypothetical protein